MSPVAAEAEGVTVETVVQRDTGHPALVEILGQTALEVADKGRRLRGEGGATAVAPPRADETLVATPTPVVVPVVNVVHVAEPAPGRGAAEGPPEVVMVVS